MTIQELADRADVTPRTIRYYVEQGILPPPERGRPSEYTDEHLRVLDMVRMLKEQYLPLEEIRTMMRDLTVSQIEEYLNRTTPGEDKSNPAHDSAADYVARVLSRGATREQLKQAVPQTAPVLPAPQHPVMPAPRPVPAPSHAPAAVPPSVPQPGPRVAPAPYPATYGAPAAPAAPGGPAQPGMAPGFPGVATPAPLHQPYAEPGETWQRVRLGPGLELHYLASSDSRRQGTVAKIVEAARHILARESGNQTEE